MIREEKESDFVRTLTDSDEMREYLRGVLARAGHHAQNVEACAMAIFGAIVAYKDKGTNLEVMQQDGEMKNVLWVQIKSNRYAFTYNHHTKCIEMREKSTRGQVKETFDDSWTLKQIRDLFSQL